MGSVAVKGSYYLTHSQSIDRKGPFRYRILAEGDSWMDASTVAKGSLPHFLAQEFDRRGVSALIINVSTSGDTLKRITKVMNGEFAWWLRQDSYDAILFSAGGNDFIDAARIKPAGSGLLRDMAGQPEPTDGFDCVRQEALRALIDDYLNPNFDTIATAVRADPRNANTPIFLNCYDTPTARNARVAPRVGPWLYKAYRTNSIPMSLWPSLTAGLFREIRQVIEAWPVGRTDVHVIPTTGVLVPAEPGSTGSSNDWANEIHPNASGWRKQARIWADRILAKLPSP